MDYQITQLLVSTNSQDRKKAIRLLAQTGGQEACVPWQASTNMIPTLKSVSWLSTQANTSSASKIALTTPIP